MNHSLGVTQRCIISTLMLLSVVLFGAPEAHTATQITLQPADSLIQWGSGFPRNGEYKDIQLAPSQAGGSLLMYLPITRPQDGKHIAALLEWDSTQNAFVDRTGSGLSFQNEDSPHDTYDVDFADVDGDGNQDIIHSSPHGNFLYINNGSGSYTDVTSARFPALARTDKVDIWDDVVAGDVDADGDVDLIFSNRTFEIGDGRGTWPESTFWGPNLLLYNDGEGFFNRAPADVIGNFDLFSVDSDSGSATSADPLDGKEGSSHGIKLGDFNNDGRVDMVISHSRNYQSRSSPSAPMADIYINQGSTLDGRVNWSPSPLTGSYAWNVGVFDADNDGNLDLYFARSGNDTIYLGNGNGTFGSAQGLSGLADAIPSQVGELPIGSTSYDVVFGDLNDDGRMDIVAPDADGGFVRANKVFLNDTSGSTLAFERSNDAVVNPVCNAVNAANNCTDWASRPFQVTAAIADLDDDGDLDIVWGSDGRVNPANDPPDEFPTITRNTSASMDDNTMPKIEHPRIVLSANDVGAAVFSARVTERVQDLDELTVGMQWAVQGSMGHSNMGSSLMRWASIDRYQARMACRDLKEGFFAEEVIGQINWAISATDVSGNNIIVDNDDVGAPALQPSFSDGTGTALTLSIREPLEDSGTIVPNDGTGRLLVRVSVTPSNFLPDTNGFEVLINDVPAQVLSGERVGNEYWLVVETSAGPNGAHDLQVRYRLCDYLAESAEERNAVIYDDDVRLSDTVLVVDASGSMDDDRKIESAINAAKLYSNTMRDQERIGIVEYSGESGSLASDVFDVALAGAVPSGGPPPGGQPSRRRTGRDRNRHQWLYTTWTRLAHGAGATQFRCYRPAE